MPEFRDIFFFSMVVVSGGAQVEAHEIPVSNGCSLELHHMEILRFGCRSLQDPVMHDFFQIAEQ